MAIEEVRVVSADRVVAARPAQIFGLIADPVQQPLWDGNDNLAEALDQQRISQVGEVFAIRLTSGQVRENHVIEFVENRLIAWKPAEPGQQPPGHLWRWELEPVDQASTRVTHTYDWTGLADETRFERARATTSANLAASLARLAEQAENL